LERTTVSWTGVGGAGEAGGDDAIGDTGFICSPLKTEGCKRTGWAVAAGVVATGVATGVAAGTGIAGEEERTFSRCACRYALLLREGVSGKAGTRAGLGLVGVRAFCEKGEKVLGWRSSSFGEGTWTGSARLSPLESEALRWSNGTPGAVGEIARDVRSAAGAREKRRPIWTVALLSVLACRLLPMLKKGFGLSNASNSRLTSVTELLRLKRRMASLEILDSLL
jgi:hypothetical protein